LPTRRIHNPDNHMLKAVVFDMDGVIADSEPIHVKAEKESLLAYGVRLSDEELHGFMGFGIEPMLEKLIEKYRVDVDPGTLYRAHQANLMNQMRLSVEPIPGSVELIRLLRDLGIPVGLASSAFRQLVDLVLGKFGIRSSFRIVVTVDDITKSKPDPEIYLKAAERLGADAGACLAIEDSTNGVRAAKAAGMSCVGFRSPNSLNQDLGAADRIVDDLREIGIDTLRELGFAIPEGGDHRRADMKTIANKTGET
jgi:HAD superfamily hydrolase (TIGR01509 family)